MSGLEVLGAISGSAQLLELTIKSAYGLGILIKRIRDREAIKTANDLSEQLLIVQATAESVRDVLNLHHEQVKGSRPSVATPPERDTWATIAATLPKCTKRLQEFNEQLDDLLQSRETSDGFLDKAKVEFKLSVRMPTITRLKEELRVYVESLTLLVSLTQSLRAQRTDAIQLRIHRDTRYIRDFVETNKSHLDNISQRINQLGHMQRQLRIKKLASQSLHSADTLAVDPEEYDALSSHVTDVLTVARDVNASLYSPEQTSVASRSIARDFSPITSGHASERSPDQSEVNLGGFRRSPPSAQIEDHFSDATHIEPLQELSKRLQAQADLDYEQEHFLSAEHHLCEAMKTKEELHTCYGIPFDTYGDLKLKLAEIYAKQKKYAEAHNIWLSGSMGPIAYDLPLGGKDIKHDMNNTQARFAARAYTGQANTYFHQFKANDRPEYLASAESSAKKAFRLLRDLTSVDAPELQEVVRLLVALYTMDQNDKGIYADTYRRLYLQHMSTDDLLHPLNTRYSTSTDARSTSIAGSTDSSLIDKIRRHENLEVEYLQNNADLDEKRDGKSAMMFAIDCGCNHCNNLLDKLLLAGADRNAPFNYAISQGKRDQSLRLLRADAKIDHLDDDDLTPLMRAVKQGLPEMISLLISYKADLNVQGERGRTALHFAARKGSLVILQRLLMEGAQTINPVNLNCQDADGLTALHECVKQDNCEFAKLLLRSDAKPDVTDFSNLRRTPLYIAIREDKLEMVETLVKGGAPVIRDMLPMRHVSRDVRLFLDREAPSRRISVAASSVSSQSSSSTSPTSPRRRSRNDSIFSRLTGRRSGEHDKT